MRKAYKEIDTLWIVNEKLGMAIECDTHRDYDIHPLPNERCITHSISQRHPASILELKQRGQVPIPLWFWKVVHEYDGMIAV